MKIRLWLSRITTGLGILVLIVIGIAVGVDKTTSSRQIPIKNPGVVYDTPPQAPTPLTPHRTLEYVATERCHHDEILTTVRLKINNRPVNFEIVSVGKETNAQTATLNQQGADRGPLTVRHIGVGESVDITTSLDPFWTWHIKYVGQDNADFVFDIRHTVREDDVVFIPHTDEKKNITFSEITLIPPDGLERPARLPLLKIPR